MILFALGGSDYDERQPELQRKFAAFDPVQRPVDGSMPSAVPDLVLTPVGAGIVLVQWGLASLAENYRVKWRLSGSAAEPTEVGLFMDRQCSITGLPTGVNIVVSVSARNDSGETVPTEGTITVG